MNKPTMPVKPWEIEWDHVPSEQDIAKARKLTASPDKKATVHKISTAQSTAVRALSGRTFMGALNVSDLHYMAMALLQVHDEMCELRERVRLLERDK